MIPIRVKFDPRYQQFQLIESYNGHLFEDGDDYCLVPDNPNSHFGTDDDDIRLMD